MKHTSSKYTSCTTSSQDERHRPVSIKTTLTTHKLLNLLPESCKSLRLPKASGKEQKCSLNPSKSISNPHSSSAEPRREAYVLEERGRTWPLETILALGGEPAELQRAFDDGVDIQRSICPVDEHVEKLLSDPREFRARMGQLDQYSNFLVFFIRQIEAKG